MAIRMGKFRVQLPSVESTALPEPRYRGHGIYLSRGSVSHTLSILKLSLREVLEERITGRHIRERKQDSARLLGSQPLRRPCIQLLPQPSPICSRVAMFLLPAHPLGLSQA